MDKLHLFSEILPSYFVEADNSFLSWIFKGFTERSLKFASPINLEFLTKSYLVDFFQPWIFLELIGDLGLNFSSKCFCNKKLSSSLEGS